MAQNIFMNMQNGGRKITRISKMESVVYASIGLIFVYFMASLWDIFRAAPRLSLLAALACCVPVLFLVLARRAISALAARCRPGSSIPAAAYWSAFALSAGVAISALDWLGKMAGAIG